MFFPISFKMVYYNGRVSPGMPLRTQVWETLCQVIEIKQQQQNGLTGHEWNRQVRNEIDFRWDVLRITSGGRRTDPNWVPDDTNDVFSFKTWNKKTVQII